MISMEEMGARANQKLIEMRTKEDFDKPVMKTKVTLITIIPGHNEVFSD